MCIFAAEIIKKEKRLWQQQLEPFRRSMVKRLSRLRVRLSARNKTLVPRTTVMKQKWFQTFYPSPWFQIRPYASIGVEYDVLGTPDDMKFKFGPSKSYSEYDVEINPWWANIGAGVEILSANGIQVAL